MTRPHHITVTAPEGRLTPIHQDDGVQPGGGLLYVKPGTVARVRWSQTIRRAIARNDLAFCDMNGAPVESAELARADVEVDPGAPRQPQHRPPAPRKEGPA